MRTPVSRSIAVHFQSLQDPRTLRQNTRHLFLDVLVIAICAVLCGANDWVAVAQFGQAQAAWLHGLLALPNGIPSHDTFTRIFSLYRSGSVSALLCDVGGPSGADPPGGSCPH
jgi:hypothetical protein